MKYDFISDPGHGWLKVKRSELHRLGIAQQISCCSYQRGDWVYLEEDDDLGRFLAAKKERGEEMKYRTRSANWRASRVRNYDGYLPTPEESKP